MDQKRKLPEKCEIDFIICDNTLNRKGWRLLVEGIDTVGFLKNPVCIVQHDMWTLSVGKWKNLRVENSQFLGTLEFDKNDDDAIKLYWKYIDGFMNAVSLHIAPIEESSDPAMLEKGQMLATITKSDLLEISLVTVPGQKNAVKLSTPEGEDYKLSIVNINQNQNPKKMEKDPEKEELQKKLDAQMQLNANNLVKLHVQRGVIQDAEVEHLKKLASTDYETVEKMLEARSVPVAPTADGKKPEETTTEGKKLAAAVEEITKGGEKLESQKSDKDSWTYLDWFKKDPKGLSLMAEKEPEKFKKLEADFVATAETEGLKA